MGNTRMATPKPDHEGLAFSSELVPDWALRGPKSSAQTAWDFCTAPFRMAILPDLVSERCHMTSLRAERFAAVLPHLRGRVLDIGAGDNMLVRLYRKYAEQIGATSSDATDSVGADIMDWGSDCRIIEDAANLPFKDDSFDTVSFIACINHIIKRGDALKEAKRVVRPGGRVLITMIGPLIGKVGHAIWWYSEDKHREVDKDELMGMSPGEIRELLKAAGFELELEKRFVYGLNWLYVARA